MFQTVHTESYVSASSKQIVYSSQGKLRVCSTFSRNMKSELKWSLAASAQVWGEAGKFILTKQILWLQLTVSRAQRSLH